jgi:feruloyl-CoA synthase
LASGRLTRAAFDADGFYCMGDAVRMVDPKDPGQGFVFDGRIAEDFKLATGTWVSVGPLRARVIAQCAPLVRDVVIAGHDRDEVGVLIVPDEPACRALCPALGDAPLSAVLDHAAVRARFAALLAAVAREGTGSASRVARAILMAEPPSLDANEITDKGSLNQRAILARRAALVEELYASPPSARVIVVATE